MNNNNNTKLDKDIEKKLYEYQIEHTKNLIYILKKNTTCLDASETGTGKTYCAIAVCKQLNLKPIIICPKSVISVWKKVCKNFNLEPFFIVNYETLKYGKYYINNQRIKCPYLDIIEKPYNIEKNNNKEEGEYHIYPEYRWNIKDEDIIFIFDEVHKCCEIDSLNGKLLYYAKLQNKKMLLLSATIADIPEKFRLFFFILNFIDPEQVKNKKMTYRTYMITMTRWILRDKKPMLRIHSMLYPDRASIMKISLLGDLFPETQIIAEPYYMGNKRQMEIEKEYKIIYQELENLKDKKKKDKQNPLVRIMRAHQRIEILKISTFVELTNDYLENGYSVVIFVNFTKTLETLADMLYAKCVIQGGQELEVRDKNISDFQENKCKVIICNIKAGSTGLSLHDLNGKYPRVSLISPTWNSIELVQALGRIHRAGGKSKSLQRIIYCANTVEDKISDKIKLKLNNINDINNGDIDLTNIKFENEWKYI
jgi:hypothetical protein